MKHLSSSGPGNRLLCILMGILMIAVVGCGGGGSVSSSGGTVNVSLAAIPQSSAAGSLAVTADSAPLARPAPPGGIVHAWITVYRVELIPGGDGTSPDTTGESAVQDDGSSDPGHVGGIVSPAEEVDLLALTDGTTAHFLNAIDNVPAGTYHKIRLYYRDPKVQFEGAVDNTVVHGTANYHLDIHFVGGDLVIPVATDPDGGTMVHDVTVVFALGKDGLKITVNPNRILMRPQVFATVGDVRYVITGIVGNVDKTLGTFELATAGGVVYGVEYDADTDFFFRDSSRWFLVSSSTGIPALNDNAIADVLGVFGGGTLLADDILITFPDTLEGDVDEGWRLDNTFVLRIPGDNVVIPQPDRTGAYYDNLDSGALLSDAAIDNNVLVKARGYLDPGTGLLAYWISVGP